MLLYMFVFFIKRPLLDLSELSLVASVCPSACLVILLGKAQRSHYRPLWGESGKNI